MDTCLFCKIIEKEISSKIRFENDEFIAFDDINPKAKTHILLVPKRHIQSVVTLEESDYEMIGKLVLTAQAVAKTAGLQSYRLVFNSGSEAGQAVDHIHLHILGGNKLGNIA